jgi:hypothetical protein
LPTLPIGSGYRRRDARNGRATANFRTKQLPFSNRTHNQRGSGPRAGGRHQAELRHRFQVGIAQFDHGRQIRCHHRTLARGQCKTAQPPLLHQGRDIGEGHGHASSQEIGHGRSPAILSAGSGRPAGARATPHIGFPDFSSSKVTATAPIADNRTFSPSTSATRPRSM